MSLADLKEEVTLSLDAAFLSSQMTEAFTSSPQQQSNLEESDHPETQCCWGLMTEMASSMALCSLWVGVDIVRSSWRAIQQYPFMPWIFTKILLFPAPCLTLGIH